MSIPENPSGRPLAAMSTLGMTAGHVGRNVALLFANGDPQRPVIMGVIHSPLHDLIVSYDPTPRETAAEAPSSPAALNVDDVTIDGKRIVF